MRIKWCKILGERIGLEIKRLVAYYRKQWLEIKFRSLYWIWEILDSEYIGLKIILDLEKRYNLDFRTRDMYIDLGNIEEIQNFVIILKITLLRQIEEINKTKWLYLLGNLYHIKTDCVGVLVWFFKTTLFQLKLTVIITPCVKPYFLALLEECKHVFLFFCNLSSS